MQWYYVKNGAQTGPVSEADFSALIASGGITNQTLVWNETMKDWKPYGDVSASRAPSSVGTGCSICGQPVAENELLEFEGARVCAACKPKFIQQIQENSEISGVAVMRYAGFWIRFAAVFIDGLVCGVITVPLNIWFQVIMAQIGTNEAVIPLVIAIYVCMLLIPALYMIFMHGKYGATLGKKAVGIKVVMSDGSPITYGRATGRYFAYLLSGLIIYIGYIMAGFDDEKRALHDRMCNTRVIYK